MTKYIPISLPHTTCDVIKVVAMLLVVTSHIVSVALGSAYGADHWSFYVMATQSGYTGVAIFFFLSGYGLMESERKRHLSFRRFISKRLVKIYFPAVLVTAMWLAVNTFTPPHYESRNPLIYELLWGFADPVMWFVRVLLPLYIAFGLTTIIIRKCNEKIAVRTLLAVCVLFAILSIVLNDSVRDHSVPLFALGVIASVMKSNKNALLKFSGLILIIGVVTSAAVFFTSHPLTGFVHSFFDYIVVWIMVMFISIKKPEWKLTAAITAITFDIYLVHFKYFELASTFMPLTLFLILSIPGSIVIAYLFHKLRSHFINPILSR